MPEIVVIDLAHVTLDGVPAGSVTDLLVNHADVEGIRSATLAALQAWHDGHCHSHSCECDALRTDHDAALKAAREAHTAECETLCNQHEEVCKALHEEQAAKIAEANRKIENLQATIAEQQETIDALGGTELGQRLAKEARVKAAQEALAKAQADLDAVTVSP